MGALFGYTAILSFLVLYSVAAFSDPAYVFGRNYLSDLGVGKAAWAFNSGLIVCGVLLLAFVWWGVRPLLGSDASSRASVVLLLMCGFFLINIGIFTEDYGDIHGVFSYAFFLTFLVALCVLAISLRRTGALGLPGQVVTAGTFVFGLALLPFGTGPAVETAAVFGLVLWGLAFSTTMLVSRPSEG